MSTTVAARLPRGIRNNNPGNIRHGVDWQGDEPDGVRGDAEFERFVTPLEGLRALMRVLLTYQRRHRLRTVRDLVRRYAPPAENDTGAYVRAVAGRLGVDPGAAIDIAAPAVLVCLAKAICRHECGPAPAGRPTAWYDDATYEEAARRALEG